MHLEKNVLQESDDRKFLISRELIADVRLALPLTQISSCSSEERAARRVQDAQGYQQNKSETAGKSVTET